MFNTQCHPVKLIDNTINGFSIIRGNENIKQFKHILVFNGSAFSFIFCNHW